MLNNMLQALSSAGLRMTPQRKAVCRVLANSREHPSAQMIYDQLKPEFDSLSLATVYNTLDTLSRLGVIGVLGEVGESGSVRYDADLEPHVNLSCVRCQQIIDLPSRHILDLDDEIQKKSGYALLSARVLYFGVCPECQAKEDPAKTTADHPNNQGAAS